MCFRALEGRNCSFGPGEVVLMVGFTLLREPFVTLEVLMVGGELGRAVRTGLLAGRPVGRHCFASSELRLDGLGGQLSSML